jgi:hypothetical protein
MNATKLIFLIMTSVIVLAATNIFTGCVKEIEEVKATGVVVKPFAVMVSVDNNAILTGTFTPSVTYDRSMTWTSANPDIATVEVLADEYALVTPHSIGETIITGTTVDGGFTSSSTVIVNPIEIDDDYATLVPCFYFGNTKINEETVDIGKLVTVKYHSRNKIVFLIDEKLQLSRTEKVECEMNVNYIADLTKTGTYTYAFSADLNVAIMGSLYPASIEGVITTQLLNLVINIKDVPDLGDILINFKGSGKREID